MLLSPGGDRTNVKRIIRVLFARFALCFYYDLVLSFVPRLPRQVREEVGLKVDSHDFECLGRLDDFPVSSYGGSKSLSISPFVFVQLQTV